jgi:hypothetical protein
MPPRAGRAVLALSAMGFPLTQRVIRRFGLRGALVVEAACGRAVPLLVMTGSAVRIRSSAFPTSPVMKGSHAGDSTRIPPPADALVDDLSRCLRPRRYREHHVERAR